MPRCWYVYVGGNALERDSYFRGALKPGCLSGVTICAIYAPNCDINPSPLSSNLQNYITNAISTGVPQPQLPGAKKYVYLKTF